MTTVYTFPSGYAIQADQTYGGLRHYNLSPSWGPSIDGTITIQLPNEEVSCLRLMQQSNPARFGNAPAEE